jgi:tetratricopeptide (TPR) repeat protein
MAYVRKRGKQLLIVQGNRDSQTGKVGQQTLFTIYSKAEALQILGRGNGGKAPQFRQLIEHQYPKTKFNWRQLYKGIQDNLDVLPDLCEYKEARLRSQFRKDLCAFTRQLMLADPQDLLSAGSLIQDHSAELEYLAELIRWRLDLRKQEPTEWNTDNPFYWRFALQGTGVPPDIEEHVAAFYERGDYDRAEVLFRFLADCFDGYAEGYNYLGLISLHRERLDEAVEHFRRAMDLGRKLFPKRMARSRYWSDLSTRPYIRAMRNLTLTLNRAGRYEESLEYCGHLEQECGDEISPVAYRASIYLNTGRWPEAAESALKLQGIDASQSLVTAFALFELGRIEDAMASYLHGALNYPLAARILTGVPTTSPQNYDQARDHNAGVDISRNLEGYFHQRGRRAKRLFKEFVNNPHVNALLTEIEEVRREWQDQRRTGDREAFHRMTQMQKPQFARCELEKMSRPPQWRTGSSAL